MKKILISLAVLNLLLLLGLLGLVLVAEVYPFAPGTALYELQLGAENWRLGITQGTDAQAKWAAALAERRLADLAQAQGTEEINRQMERYLVALSKATSYLPQLTPEAKTEQANLLSGQFIRAEVVAYSLPADIQAAFLAALGNQQASVNNPAVVIDPMTLLESEIQAEPVPFLNKEYEHEIFPLTGGHANQDCESCHQYGLYANTTTSCAACHSLPEDKSAFRDVWITAMMPDNFNLKNPYPEHFSGDCEDCHTTDDWTPYQFDHAEVTECQSCHLQDLPETGSKLAVRDFLASYMTGYAYYSSEIAFNQSDHYPGDCIRCHTDVTNWQEAAFDHTNIRDCESCHLAETPSGHYDRACIRCHTDTDEWQGIEFDHTGYTRCSECHQDENPSGHYRGECSACHTTSGWLPAFFNHRGFGDCKSCHENANHFKGQCSSCHNEADWFEPYFNHSAFEDCADCHASPPNHYPGQCSLCHNDRRWDQVEFSHVNFPNCSTCHTDISPSNHFGTACSNCHNTVSWQQAIFNHTGMNDCSSCHAPPTGHYPGECTECHTTATWQAIQFDHAGYQDCLDCHTVSANHYPGECQLCHSTEGWFDVTFVHNTATACESCHTSPTGHWPGECASCHEVDSWLNVHFDHTDYTNCKACHIKPANHPHGQCSKCHTTSGWEYILPTPTPTPTGLPDDPGETYFPYPGLPVNLPTPAPVEPAPSQTPAPLPTPAPVNP
jgi:hypothetical protein